MLVKLALSVVLVVLLAVDFSAHQSRASGLISKRSIEHHKAKHHSMLHNHMSKKVFERACAAPKDVVQEIILCVTDNKDLMKNLNLDNASECHKEAFGTEFDKKDMMKHKDEICKQREKFEEMVSCVYHKVTENANEKVMEELTGAMVDVGLCIINALDG